MFEYILDLLKVEGCAQHEMCMLAIQKEISQGNITDIYLCCFDQVFF